MANITYLAAVNRVLRRLREAQVTTLNGASSYTALIGEFVNESKEEVEAAWAWNAEHLSFDVSVTAGTASYSLTNFGDEFTIELVFDTTNNYYLRGPITAADMQALSYLNEDLTNGAYVWALDGKDSNGDPKIKFYPVPNQDTTINLTARVKGQYLENDDDEIKVPWRPVVLGAYMRAISERGEDGGVSYDEANRSYEKALADAISLDANLGHTTKDWSVD